MADAGLRALERAARDSPAAGLRYARALVQAGRAPEARALLLGLRDDPGARHELGRFPGWRTGEGDVPGARHADVPLPPRAPRPLQQWIAGTGDPLREVLGCDLGLVRLAQGEASGHHPETLARRWTLPSAGPHARVHVEGELLLAAAGGSLRVDDLWTGQHLATLPLAGQLIGHGDGLLFTREGGRLQASALGRAPLRVEPVWSVSLDAIGRGRGEIGAVRAAAGTTLVEQSGSRGPGDLVALSSRDGAARWLLRGRGGAVLDARGLVRIGRDGALWAHALEDGRERWHRPGPAAPAAFGPGQVLRVVRAARGDRLERFDRASGALLGEHPLPGCKGTRALLARDGVLAWCRGPRGHELAAFGEDPEPLWRVRVPGGAERPGRLVLLPAGVVIAYDPWGAEALGPGPDP